MKTFILISFMLIIVSTSHCQTIFLKFGPSFSRLTYSNALSPNVSFNDFIIGFDAIAGVNYLNFKYFNLSSGIGFIQKGGTVIYQASDHFEGHVNIDATTRLNFLTINTTFNLRIPTKKLIKPYILVGPRLDYLISYNEAVTQFLAPSPSFIKVFDDEKKLSKVIYGLLLGGGINFEIKRIELGLALEYYFNINKLVDFDGVTSLPASKPYKLNDNTFTLNAFVGFKF